MPWPRSMEDSATMNLPSGLEWTRGLARIAAEVHADRIVDGGEAAPLADRHRQRLLRPENGGESRSRALRGVGSRRGVVRSRSRASGSARSSFVGRLRCRGRDARAGPDVGRSARPPDLCRRRRGRASGAQARTCRSPCAPATRPARRRRPFIDDIALNRAPISQPAFSAATWQHSTSAVFFATRRCAFMSPSR